MQKFQELVWRRGNRVRDTNEVTLRLVLGAVTTFCDIYPDLYPGNRGPLSLAIPLWVSAISTGDGFVNLWEETSPIKLRLCGDL